MWEVVKFANSAPKYNTREISGLLIADLIIVAILFSLRIFYSVISVILYFHYIFEKLFGTGIFRLIIKSTSHQLRPGFYIMFPLSGICILAGAIGTIIYQFNKATDKA